MTQVAWQVEFKKSMTVTKLWRCVLRTMIPGGEGKWVKICFNSLTNLPSWGKSIEDEEGPGSSSHTWHASPASRRRAHCWCAFKGKPSHWSCRPAAAEWLKLGECVKAATSAASGALEGGQRHVLESDLKLEKRPLTVISPRSIFLIVPAGALDLSPMETVYSLGRRATQSLPPQLECFLC